MSKAADVIVIGGGVIGLCSAYYLRRAGASVTVLEMEDVGNGSSLKNAGYVSPSHFVPLAAPGVFAQGLRWMLRPTSPLYIEPRLDLGFLAWVVRFARSCNPTVADRAVPVLRDLLFESQRLYEDMFQTDVPECDYVQKGLTVVYRTAKGRRAVEHEAAIATRIGVDTKLLDHSGLQAMDPAMEFLADGGLYFPCDGHLVPQKLMGSLASAVTAAGVDIRRNCRFERWAPEDSRIKAVHTNDGPLSAQEYVLAAGAWSPSLVRPLGLRMLLQAGKGYSITYTDPPAMPRHPYILQEARVAITPFPGAVRLAGTMEITRVNTAINRRRVEAILDAAPRYFANYPRPRAEEGDVWGGMRPVTPDGMAYVGRYRSIPNLIVATGHAMLGISLAPVTGKIVAEIVSGESRRDLGLLDPNRFS
jgi:D-amino-acid dehydrogenase